jgi:peptidoglycan/xylan/chitin deacetylase (PgdA/CDA1 family)
MKAIMYHYVQEVDISLPYFKFLDIDNFKKQLDYFERLFGFVNFDDFINSFVTGEVPKGVVLTFDDALMCHYSYVYKELKRRNLWGIFYVPTLPYSSGKILDVHRVHLLLGLAPSKDIYVFLKSLISPEILDSAKYDEFLKNTYTFQNNDEYTTYIKRSMNYFISYKYRSLILDLLMNKFVPNEHDYARVFYMSEQNITEMKESGMLIGSHSVDHSVMSRLTVSGQKQQINDSIKYLEGLLGTLQVKTFCYPYGGFTSFTADTEEILTKEGFLFSFNVEHRDVTRDDLILRSQALPRYDCNFFQYGKCNI